MRLQLKHILSYLTQGATYMVCPATEFARKMLMMEGIITEKEDEKLTALSDAFEDTEVGRNQLEQIVYSFGIIQTSKSAYILILVLVDWYDSND